MNKLDRAIQKYSLSDLHASARVLVNHFEQLIVHILLFVLRTALDRMRHAVLKMIAHQGTRNGAESLVRGRKLCEDVHTVAILFHHPLYAPKLTFDPAEPA